MATSVSVPLVMRTAHRATTSHAEGNMYPTKNEDGTKIMSLASAATALADHRYATTAGAILELVENSVRSGASTVEVFVAARKRRQITTWSGSRNRSQIGRIAVLDNGAGMDPATMQLALQFGGTTGAAECLRGMGLPTASISECERVDVWSWQNGLDNAYHTYLDFAAIREGQLTEVPEPQPKSIPKRWREAARNVPIGESGTMVVWSKLTVSRLQTAEALHPELTDRIGRSFRRWLAAGKHNAYVTEFYWKQPTASLSHVVQTLDPLDLLPAPWRRGRQGPSCFAPFPDLATHEVSIPVVFDGKEHLVSAKFSMLRPEFLEWWFSSANPSRALISPGLHGLSVVRAGREILQDRTFAVELSLQPQLWRAEISFEPALDAFFGLANNKQEVRNLSAANQMALSDLVSKPGQTAAQVRDELAAKDDPRAPWVEVMAVLESRRDAMLRAIAEAKFAHRNVREGRQAEEQPIVNRARKVREELQRPGEVMPTAPC